MDIGTGFYRDIAAIFAVFSSVIAIGLSVFQMRSSQRASGARVFMDIEEQFYHTPLFRNHRKLAALELLSVADDPELKLISDTHIMEIFNFFEFVGVLVEEKALNSEMVRSSFYRRGSAYWTIAESLGVLETWRLGHPWLYIRYERLLKVLGKAQDQKSRTKMTKAEAMTVVLSESRLNL